MSAVDFIGLVMVLIMVAFIVEVFVKGYKAGPSEEEPEVVTGGGKKVVKLSKVVQELLDCVKNDPNRFTRGDIELGYLMDSRDRECYWGSLDSINRHYERFQLRDTVTIEEFEVLCKEIKQFYKGRLERKEEILRLRKARKLRKGLTGAPPKKEVVKKEVVLGEKAQCLLDYVTKYPGRFIAKILPNSFYLDGLQITERTSGETYCFGVVHSDLSTLISPEEWRELAWKVKSLYEEREERLSCLKGERLLRKYCSCDAAK